MHKSMIFLNTKELYFAGVCVAFFWSYSELRIFHLTPSGESLAGIGLAFWL